MRSSPGGVGANIGLTRRTPSDFVLYFDHWHLKRKCICNDRLHILDWHTNMPRPSDTPRRVSAGHGRVLSDLIVRFHNRELTHLLFDLRISLVSPLPDLQPTIHHNRVNYPPCHPRLVSSSSELASLAHPPLCLCSRRETTPSP